MTLPEKSNGWKASVLESIPKKSIEFAELDFFAQVTRSKNAA
jgi:hypothetical protein